MPADNDLDPLDRWLSQPVWPMSAPDGTFERISKRARRRRVRKTVAAVASAAAVVAAIAVAVPLGLSSGLGPSGSTGNVAAGGSPSGTRAHSVAGPAMHTVTPSPARASLRPTPGISSAASSAASATSPGPTGIASPGYLPANFEPSSVTWVSASTGYVIGQAGTPGTCGAGGSSDVCTSIAVTHDTGATWSGLAAPPTGAASGLAGVSGLRFLNGDDGWAYGPELWSTTDASAAVPTWTKVNTGGQVVTDLETANGRAFAIFATCPSDVQQASIAYQCTSFTLKTSVAGSGTWTDVSGVPAGLTPNTVDNGRAVLVVSPTTAYLITPQNVLYSGPLDGGAWQQVGALPCTPSDAYLNNGIARPVELATAGTANGQARLALSCAHDQAPAGAGTILWISGNGGATWARQTQLGTDGNAAIGTPASITGNSAGTVILATSSGIYYLPLGGSRWQQARLAGSAPGNGFSYVGMTTPSQGVAIGDPAGTQIWLTGNGGLTWQAQPIQS